VRGQAAINAGSGSFAASGILDFLLQASAAGVQTTGDMNFNQAIAYGDGSVLALAARNAPLQSDGRLVWSTTLHLNLPENSQSIPVQVALTSSGIQAALSNLRLQVAGSALTLNGVTLGNGGLTVQSASLALPAALGGGTAGVEQVTITPTGLNFNRIVLAPNVIPTLGAGGFRLALQSFALEKATGGRAYEFVITGQIDLTTPGVAGSAVASLRLDGSGNFRGSVSDMQITSAGLTIRAGGISVDGTTLRAQSATLVLPSGLGGASLTVNNLALSPTGLTIGGGGFSLPDIDVGGFRLTGLRGSFVTVTGGYAIEAAGGFTLPNLGGKGCSGLAVSVRFRIEEAGVLVLDIAPASAPMMASPVNLSPFNAAATDRFVFEHLALELRCTIPIGNTGLEIVAVRGSVTVAQGSQVTISVGMTVESSLKTPKPLFAADADVTMRAQPFLLTFDGTVRLFGETMGGAQASIESGRTNVTLWVDYKIFEGRVVINAWSDAGGFHFTGEGYVGVKLEKGNILDLGWLKVPPTSMSVGGVKLGVGEFTNRQWGFRGQVCVWKYCTGVYVDTGGAVHFGNVDQYTLAQPKQLAEVREFLLAYRQGERSAADLPENIALLENGDLIITTTVTTASDLMFVLSRQSDTAPTLSLLAPGDILIEPQTQRADVTFVSVTAAGESYPYQQIFTVDGATPGVWRAVLHNPPADGYGFALLGLTPPPVLADVHARQTGANAAQVTWRLDAAQPVTVSVYANAGTITQTLTLTGSVPVSAVVESFSGARLLTLDNALADGSPFTATVDLALLPSNVYRLWVDADDGINPPVRLYAAEPITVAQAWTASWQADLAAIRGFQQIGVSWRPHPSPDVQGYIVSVSAQPFTFTRTIAVGMATETILNGLNSNTFYHIWVEAVVYDADGAVIRTAQSEVINVTPLSVPFDLTLASAPATVQADVGATITLHLRTDAGDFPEPVSFYPAGQLPTGIDIDLSTAVITPTQAGLTVPVTLTASTATPGGPTQIAILGSGGGVTRTLVVSFTLAQAGISLQAEPQNLSLHQGGGVSSQILVTATGQISGSVLLFVQNVPPGISAQLEKELLLPGESTLLRIQAGELAAPGSYDLEVIAQAASERRVLPVHLVVLSGRVFFLPLVER